MNCRKYQKLISKFEDGLLSEEEKQLLYRHCEVCESCREEVFLAHKLDDLLKEHLNPVDPPENLISNIMDVLPETVEFGRPRTRVASWRNLGLAAAALFLVISVASFGLWPGSGDNIAVDNPDNTSDIVIADNSSNSDPVNNITDENNATDENNVNPDTDIENPNTDDPDEIAADPHNTETTNPGSENEANEEDSGQVNLPIVASGGKVWGDIALTLVAEHEGSDVLLPVITEEGQIEYLISDNGSYQLWQKSISSTKQAVLLEESYTGSLTDRESYVEKKDYGVAVSPDGTMVAANAKGESTELWISDNNSEGDPTVYCENAGGNLLSWAPNSGKLVFDDANGCLYVVYPAEDVVFLVFEGKVESVCWTKDSKILVFAARDNDDTNIKLYQVTLP